MKSQELEAMKEEKINGFNKWEVKDWVHTLKKAIEIENDEKKMEAVKKLMPDYLKEEEKEAKMEIKSIEELRNKYNSIEK